MRRADILEFLDLKSITLSDKYWVTFRLIPRFLVEVFAIDCACEAQEYADYAAADYAAYAAAYAATSERERSSNVRIKILD